MLLLDGKKTSEEIQLELKDKVSQRVKKGLKRPHLAAVLVGDDGASKTYVGAKVKMCEKLGFESSLFERPSSIDQEELLSLIDQLNNDDQIDGYIVQLPLPKHINEELVLQAVNPDKDVDGFHPTNFGRMTLGLEAFIPATPKGILELLKRNNIETEGKKCVVIGRSHIVGLPMTILMSQNNYPGNSTVTMLHSRSKNLVEECAQADIIVAALGKPEFVKANMVKENAVIIDVGITRVPSTETKSGFRLKGDVDFNDVKDKVSAITPVPGGVGPMTIISLMMNTLQACERKS